MEIQEFSVLLRAKCKALYNILVIVRCIPGLISTPTEHPQHSWSYVVSTKFLLSYHYVNLMVRVCSSMGILSVNPLFSKYFIHRLLILCAGVP